MKWDQDSQSLLSPGGREALIARTAGAAKVDWSLSGLKASQPISAAAGLRREGHCVPVTCSEVGNWRRGLPLEKVRASPG